MGSRLRISALLVLVMLLNACAAEVGSERWCRQMKETPKADWTMGEARSYAEHCLL